MSVLAPRPHLPSWRVASRPLSPPPALAPLSLSAVPLGWLCRQKRVHPDPRTHAGVRTSAASLVMPYILPYAMHYVMHYVMHAGVRTSAASLVIFTTLALLGTAACAEPSWLCHSSLDPAPPRAGPSRRRHCSLLWPPGAGMGAPGTWLCHALGTSRWAAQAQHTSGEDVAVRPCRPAEVANVLRHSTPRPYPACGLYGSC